MANMELDIVSDMEVDKVADKVSDMVAKNINIDIDINMEIKFRERFDHRGWLINFFDPACASSELFEFIQASRGWQRRPWGISKNL